VVCIHVFAFFQKTYFGFDTFHFFRQHLLHLRLNVNAMQECVLADWYHLLSPEVGESKHLPVETDDEKENQPSAGE